MLKLSSTMGLQEVLISFNLDLIFPMNFVPASLLISTKFAVTGEAISSMFTSLNCELSSKAKCTAAYKDKNISDFTLVFALLRIQTSKSHPVDSKWQIAISTFSIAVICWWEMKEIKRN